GAKLGLAAFTAAAEAFREVVTEPMPKGEVSTAVSALVPKSLTFWCATCAAQHISGSLFQQAGLFGGVGVSSTGGTTLAPLTERFPVPREAAGTDRFVESFLRFLGPATPAEVARFLGTSVTVIRQVWPAGLDEVTVEGRTRWIPDSDALLAAKAPDVVRLLPPGDPLLQNRALLTRDKAQEKEIWRPIGNPGVVLVNTEIAGTWRAKIAGRGLDLTVTASGPLPDLRAEADRLGAVRGVSEVRLHL
ncbi:MAG: crosslink repair DNA glycosylase YcaQ family protein, partial [Streptosporangiaceae bacterium]